MFRRFLIKQRQHSWSDLAARHGSSSLQIVLWLLWSLVVAAVGYANGHADLLAKRPTTTRGLVIYCALTGLIGQVVMTIIEMHLEPWRFLDDK
jgi:hypothetical protein